MNNDVDKINPIKNNKSKNKKGKLIKRVIASIMLSLLLICIGMISAYTIKAAYTTWGSLSYLEFRKGQGSSKESLSNVATYGIRYTTYNDLIYGNETHYFDNLLESSTSRVLYARKIRVEDNETINIVATKNDTVDAGGESINSGLKFYWCIEEWNESGNIVYDGGWRQAKDSWTIGRSTNEDSGYGINGYPYGVSQHTRQSSVRYITPIFRWNNGSEASGSGQSLSLNAKQLSDAFPIFYIVKDNFTYTLDCNGGTARKGNEDKGSYTVERLGISSINTDSIVEPHRQGYTFTGWKVTGGTGKQKDKVYSTDTLKSMMSDGKYWSSLFENATFTAQWKANPDTAYKVEHYKQKVDSTYPSTPDETESKTGTTGSEVTPPVKTYTGFTSPSAQKVTIAADGSTVVKYYYKRNYYSLTFDWDIGVSGVTGHNNDENDIGIDKNKQYFYTYGKTEPSFIFFNNGYEFDYVEEKTPGHEQNHWSNDGTGTDNYGRFYLRENWSIQAYNRTFYIHTKPKIYKLYFEANGGTIPSDGNMGINGYLSPDRTNGNVTVTYNAPNYYLMGNDNPTREGYTFTGWYRPYWNEQGVCYKNELIYDAYGNAVESSIWHYDNEEHKYNEVHYQLTSGETLYANWKAIIYLKIILAKLLSIWYKH